MSATRTTPDRPPVGAVPLGAMPRMPAGRELSARQVKQLNSTKAGMVFKLEANADFFTWVQWQQVLQDWLAAVEAEALMLDARSTRMLATMTIEKDLLL